MGPVYEATQLSLGRPVALRLLAKGKRPAASLHHPNIVSVYEAGEWDGGTFVAMRLIHGRTLSDLLGRGALSLPRFEEVMRLLGEALSAAHGAGLVHGRVVAHNVIVSEAGAPYLTDLGLGREGSAAADLTALAALSANGPGRVRRRSGYRVLAAAAGLAAVAGVALVGRGDEEAGADSAAPPRVAAGAAPLGSELARGSLRSTGCAADPGPTTPACTVSQGAVRVQRSGVVRRWAVRGAAGELSLQVLRRRDGRLVRVGFSQPVQLRGVGPRAFPANLDVKRGDRIGVLLGPGARIGLRPRANASARLWEGNRTPLPKSASTLAGELLLRADIEAGARAGTPRRLTGARAGSAPPGRVLAKAQIDLGQPGIVHLRLVRVGQAIAIDAFRGPLRLARIAVPDVDARGRALLFTGTCEYPRAVCLRWLNDGERTTVIHAYSLGAGGRTFRVIG